MKSDWKETLKTWWYGDSRTYEQAEYFISDLLAKEKMELVERIEKMKKELVSPRTNDMTNLAFINYNQAQGDVLSSLKSEIQEKEEENG